MSCRKGPETFSRGRRRAICAALLGLGSWLVGGLAIAAELNGDAARVALVIGNGAYRNGPLRNPVADAEAVAGGLRRMGFEVTLRENTSRRDLLDALRDFVLNAPSTGVRVLYYAGHGVQFRGRNFLVPVDASLASEEDLPQQAADLSEVVERLGTAKSGMSIVILDACRSNPFGNVMMQLADARQLRTRGLASPADGLAPLSAPGGTLIAYSTAPGAVAADSPDRPHSIYTKHLLQWMAVPGLPVERMFKNVRIGVSLETRQKQVPWESSSLMGEFCFRPTSGGRCGM